MKLFKRLSAIGVAVAMAATLSSPVSAANRKAYSIGVNYYESSTKTQDFSIDAQNAANAYARISDVSSTVNKNPSTTYLANHINDNIIFLVSHGNTDNITFIYKNSSGQIVRCGYKTGKSGTYNNVSYLGLSEYSMSNVELITFVGCYTAKADNGNCITAEAVSRGAKCAVGFTNEIYPTINEGVAWLSSYNSNLASGCNVGEAVYKATQSNGNSDLGKYVSVMGYGAHKITSTSAKTYEFSDGTKGTMSSDELLKSEKSLFDFMKSYDSAFESNEYKYYVNMFDKTNNTGMVVFNHYIGGNIITNKMYTIFIENGYVTDVSKLNCEKNINEEILIEQMNSFASNYALQTYSNNDNVYKSEEHFEFDYNTGELKYIRGDFSLGEFGEIINDTTELTIGKLE